MKDFSKIREKMDAIVTAMEKTAELSDRDDSKTVAFEVPIDEEYSLVTVRGGDTVLIMSGDVVVLDFIPDDEFTIGDIIGGYLSLYEEE